MNVKLYETIYNTLKSNDAAVRELPYNEAVRFMARQMAQSVDHYIQDTYFSEVSESSKPKPEDKEAENVISSLVERTEAARRQRDTLRAAAEADAAEKAREAREEADLAKLQELAKVALSETEEEKASGPGTSFADTGEAVWVTGAEAIAKLLQEDA